jgi:hypothetical protein
MARDAQPRQREAAALKAFGIKRDGPVVFDVFLGRFFAARPTLFVIPLFFI